MPELKEYLTTDTGRAAPYPGMTEDDLQDYERWADEIDRRPFPWITLAFMVFVAGVGLTLAYDIALGAWHVLSGALDF